MTLLKQRIIVCTAILLCTYILSATPFVVRAEELSSNSFRLLDPVFSTGIFSSSTSFQLWSSFSEMVLDTSTASSFQLNAGFLRYPFASTPSVSATAGDGEVSLSWAASEGVLGWTAASYRVAQASVSGGPYTYTSLGNVTSSTRTGLSNGTSYYFVIVVNDSFGNAIASSTEISATPAASSGGSGGGGGGGGGGGSNSGNTTNNTTLSGVVITGRAYPSSRVHILKDGQLVLSTIAGPDSNFAAVLSGLSSGNYTIGVQSEDKNGIRSNLFTFPAYVSTGVIATISGVFIAPTIAVDKASIERGDTLTIFGQSAPQAEVVVTINSEKEHFFKQTADNKGIYLLTVDTSFLELGQHHAQSKAVLESEVSVLSKQVTFSVGEKTISASLPIAPEKGDVSGDERVNLTDFSIIAFWYKKPLSATFAAFEKEELNGDGKIDLVDFSIMAFYWTG